MMLVKSIELDSGMEKISHSNQSIYHIDHEWRNQSNNIYDLHQSEGKYQLISMIFTNCDYACPNLIGDMLNIDDDILDEMKNKLGFLLITMDPDRDTPEKLYQYAESMELDQERWVLLNGNVQAVNAMSLALGISYKKFENGA
ncbi:MAG: SCO family protein, partial [Reichenbachiella sp.]